MAGDVANRRGLWLMKPAGRIDAPFRYFGLSAIKENERCIKPWRWIVLFAMASTTAAADPAKITPGGYPTSRDFQITSMCAVIDAVR